MLTIYLLFSADTLIILSIDIMELFDSNLILTESEVVIAWNFLICYICSRTQFCSCTVILISFYKSLSHKIGIVVNWFVQDSTLDWKS